ncbi:alpha/beta fold hydrolase [Streptomyces rhizosphaericus]|uniref:alpha/beta fold hydrolase n=1 Tax=Streptomyces rhizosphaericus TaxID=114699 RepID=UPI00363D6C22
MTTTSRPRKNLEVRRSDHTTIRYTAGGPAGGPTLALIHGWACDRGDFDAVTDHLPEDYRVLAIDLAEHGESRSTRDVWTMEEFARDVAAVLEAESVDTCVVAGHSLGGAVAVEVGRLLPATVSHVVALDALHYLSLFPALSDEQTDATLRMFREDFAGAVRGLVEEVRRPGPARLSRMRTSRRWSRCGSPRVCVPSRVWCVGTWTRRCARPSSRSPCSRYVTW